ncbi:MAG: PD40 domain-containing protein [Anaerolineae bacterium]|nr:PD40 domain-containing protein [Anaerolineae bacterium]
MSEPKYKLGDDGELEEVIDDLGEKPKRKRKPKYYPRTLQIPLSLMLALIVGIALFGVVAYFLSHPAQPKLDDRGLLAAQFQPTETPGGIMDTIPPCAMFAADQKPRIVYTMISLSSDKELMRVNLDGTNNCILTKNNIEDSDPSWSPDGTRIVYNSMFSSAGYSFEDQLYIMNANGENIVKLTSEDFSLIGSADWSPDGQKIVFEAGIRGKPYFQVFVINADGTNLINLSNAARADTSPKWSPDGRSIVFISGPIYDNKAPPGTDQSKNDEIFVMDTGGTNLRQLTDNDKRENDPSWSPDGEWIAFNRDNNIFMMDKNGKQYRHVTDTSNGAFEPFWLPDGNEIGFTGFLDALQFANVNTGRIRFIPLPVQPTAADIWWPPVEPPHPDV